MTTLHFEAGIWEQGGGFIRWSRHRTEARARKAAKSYARHLRRRSGDQAAGGAFSWSGGYRTGNAIVWIEAYQSGGRWEYSDPLTGRPCND